MKNVWKGLIVGGLTGVAAGVVLDLGRRGSELAGTAGKRAADLAPKAAGRLKSVASTGAALLQEADLSEHVKDLAHRLGDSIADSEVTDQAREKLERATQKGVDIAHSVRDAVPAGRNPTK